MQFGSITTESSARMMRYGRDIKLGWEHDNLTGPQIAGTELAGVDVPNGYNTYIYGFSITAGEPNLFYLLWESDGTSKYYFIDFPSDGTTMYTDNIPINEGYPANRTQGSAVTRVSLYIVGVVGAGMRYSGSLLLGEILQAEDV